MGFVSARAYPAALFVWACCVFVHGGQVRAGGKAHDSSCCGCAYVLCKLLRVRVGAKPLCRVAWLCFMVGVAAYFLPTMRGWNLAAWEQAHSVENEQVFVGMTGVHIPIWNGWAVLSVGCRLDRKNGWAREVGCACPIVRNKAAAIARSDVHSCLLGLQARQAVSR